jgi:hypothetical protein
MRPYLLPLLGAAFIAAVIPGRASADCTCRARGLVAEHGQTVCIRTPEGFRLARCDKVSNVASWTFLSGACPQIASNITGMPGVRSAVKLSIATATR